MKYFSVLIKPASSICNLRCKYCFYCDVASNRNIDNLGIMNDETRESMINKIFDYFRNDEATITFAFQGGEPTCATIDYFKSFIDDVSKKKKDYHTVQYAIQTNGVLLNNEWIKFFKENQFLVGVSLDGFKENHDSLRPDAQNGDTFNLVMANIEKLRENNVEFNILTVLTSQLAKKPKELFQFYLEHHFSYIQLIPCLPSLDHMNDDYSLKPKEFYEFYHEFYQLWLKEYQKGNYLSVTLFDNLIPLFVGMPPSQCGYLGFCSVQTVIEADGSVYPCDFYALDEYKIGNIKELGIEDIMRSSISKLFLSEKKEFSNRCENCRYIKICGGQCKRLNICYFDKNYCGLEEFLTAHEKTMCQIAWTLIK
ncbi:MAG: radical SAM protein [Anaerorhabdus sp.]